MRFGLAALVLLIAAVAYGQSKLPVRDFGVTWSRGAARVSFSAVDLADERVRRELSSGLRKRMEVTVSAHLSGSNWKMGVRQFGCDVTRDLWEDGYLVRIGDQSERLKTLEQVLDRCLIVKGLFVGEPKSYELQRGRDIYFAVKAEFNPISKRQCTELIRPASGADPVGPISVNIVRRRICKAERSIVFRSEIFEVPE
ncbi:MAG: hypothetical protein KJO40_01635 [Deltaproteobacteria bacterium]|nr:hypothetical protein [Deltaproteobacteria bacterium]NND27099.1 hypothetical protein [Myxococcales bacterium]MBT8466690.1 hypothetical protein [Deltaproteobacteria bacterium]MBT8483701.1 hypothetical protein [Deltaproteobacteria bacterium]NNK09227.1 hypothetical protein [Myxococcales bacterium]